MDAQDYPIRHFEYMAKFAAELKEIPAQVLEHEYRYDAFGSWLLVVRCKGVPLRVVFDGKEGEYRIERSASLEMPYRWENESWRHPRGSDSEADRANLIAAIVRLSAAS
jgi:hypothetical protein